MKPQGSGLHSSQMAEICQEQAEDPIVLEQMFIQLMKDMQPKQPMN